MNRTYFSYISLFFLCATSIVLIALHSVYGWALYLIGLLFLVGSPKKFRREVGLIYISLGFLGITPITTDISISHMLIMGSTLLLAVGLPYIFSRFVYKNNAVTFRFHHGRAWLKREIFYVFFAGAASYFILPFYLSSGAYLNWAVTLDPGSIFRLFIGTNALGIWDELFFISVVLGILRRHLPFIWANTIQAVLFTSFLFELGFTHWGPLMIFPFALLQGHIFRKTDSLFYVITIHLTIDFVLFLALINAYYPLGIFLV